MKALSGTASGVRHAFGALSEALIITAIIGALVFGYAAVSGTSPLGASDTFAAKGGNGNGHGGNNAAATAASVSASPNPAAPGTRVEVTGCGYDINYPVELRITHPDGSLEAYGVGVWYTGCMNPTPIVVNDLGTYAIEVWQRSSRDSSLMATTSLAVAW